ncbi:MAG TPA: nucleotidyl transferase AbiEii/AbiGii toxin family protein [Streptosporangiaceae bacterium]|nr:nucleotidyl transferase AbiEii/AbiGii toxin family protein [Streptosporangiaceae bacterium]
MTGPRGYASPAAFRRALTDRLQGLAATGRWPLQHLQRQMAYDRLLERLYLADDGWVVKGAAALLARDIGVRATIDIDVYHQAASEEAEARLRAAAARDIGDWFRFEIRPARPLISGTRLPATAYIGAAVWAGFHVDLVGAGVRMTGQPEDVPPLARVIMPQVRQHGYKAYPLVDHVADKVCAMLERHGPHGAPSTRFKDLIDLVAIAAAASVAAGPQISALQSEARRRGLRLPGRLVIPDRGRWEPGYAAEARRSLLPGAATLDEALAVAGPFLDPVLAGTARGTWHPGPARWLP